MTGIMACGQGKKKPGNAANESSIWTDTKIPEEFKDYKVLNSNYENDNYETILFAKSNDYMAPSPIRVSWSVNDQVILSVCRSQEEPEPGYHHYKLNKSGEVLDSLYVPFKGGGLIGLYLFMYPIRKITIILHGHSMATLSKKR
ncbi:hypothetical protein LY11_04849 [Pedobacter cryoconitis]|uniref:Uncharacterized protein n=2 Tax=Pedobacter cryoconitis TaxID=188932 RepID=A0A327S2V6_9SPHI|nr:hypothetical protein LY11_04849 [Pedobacter cryoconitis]